MSTFGTLVVDIDELLGTDDRPARGYMKLTPATTYLPDVDGQALVIREIIKPLGKDVVTVQALSGIVWTVTFERIGAEIEPVEFMFEGDETLYITTITPPTSTALEVTVMQNASLKADKAALDAESAARAAADTALDVAIDDEAEARAEADTAINAELDGRLSEASLNGAYVSLGTAATPQYYGARGDGTTDDTAAMQAWLAAGLPAGHIPAGTYRITSGLVQPATMDVYFAAGATIKATAAMSVMWSTDVGTDVQGRKLINPTFDCNELATTGFQPRYFHLFWCQSITVINSGGHAIVIGDTATGSNRSAQMFMSDIKVRRDSSKTPPVGSYGLHIANAYDSRFTVGDIVGAKAAGVRVDVGENYFENIHVWGHASKYPDICFDDNADQTHWFECMADTPNTHCFRLRQFRTVLIDCHSYINFQGPDNTVPGVYFDKTGPESIVIGHFFHGENSSHRLASDFACSDESGSWRYWFDVVGVRKLNVVTEKVGKHQFRPGSVFRATGSVGAAQFTGDNTALLEATKFDGTSIVKVNTSAATPLLAIGNGAHILMYSDAYSTGKLRLNGQYGSVHAGGYATASRPAAATIGAGGMIYDTTLGKPVWSNGTAWKDAAGNTV